mgnify:CR=1 FL=1
MMLNIPFMIMHHVPSLIQNSTVSSTRGLTSCTSNTGGSHFHVTSHGTNSMSAPQNSSISTLVSWILFCSGIGVPTLRLFFCRFNGLYFLEKWRGKNIMFVGDSLSFNMWASLGCMIHSWVPKARYSLIRKEGLSEIAFLVSFSPNLQPCFFLHASCLLMVHRLRFSRFWATFPVELVEWWLDLVHASPLSCLCPSFLEGEVIDVHDYTSLLLFLPQILSLALRQTTIFFSILLVLYHVLS